MRIPVRFPAVLLLLLACALALCAPRPAAASEACPNEQLRTGYAASLPDCRGYERVSPPGVEPHFEWRSTNTNEAIENSGTVRSEVQASVSGGGLAFAAVQPPAGSPSGGEDVLATRGVGGWSTRDMIPPQSTDYSIICLNAYIAAYSPDLSRSLLADGVGQPGSTNKGGVLRCGSDEPLLVAGEPQGFQNLFVGEGPGAPYQLVDTLATAPPGALPNDAWFDDASEDLSHVVFEESAQLTPEAPPTIPPKQGELGTVDLYEWSGGVVRLLTLLPDGAPVQGSLVNAPILEGNSARQGTAIYTHAVSADGSRVFFTWDGDLYERENASEAQSPVEGGACTDAALACTVQIDAAQGGCGGCSGGGGSFQWASADGSRVFFSDENRLTSGSTAAAGEPDLYEYDLDAPPAQRLVDLTVDANAGEHAGVLGLSGTSEDGSYVYFTARGVLAANKREYYSHAKGETVVEEAQPGQANLYVSHDGTSTFIATLNNSEPDAYDWTLTHLTARVSPDGVFVAFDSTRSLTGYDNEQAQPGECEGEPGQGGQCREIFLYDAAHGTLSCASCDPSGARPTVGARIRNPDQNWFGGGETYQGVPGYLQRNLSDSGQVFFDTADRLLPAATNGQANVYEYENGELHLISSGTSVAPSFFYEATPDGSDVFFITAQELPSGAAGGEFAVYDARVDGGFPPAPVTAPCEAPETCRPGTPAAPVFPAPASATLTGTGQLTVLAAKTSTPPASPAHKPKPLTRAQKLKQALQKCRSKHAHQQRVACEHAARRTYTTTKHTNKHTTDKHTNSTRGSKP